MNFGKWIPVSEALPPKPEGESENYLVTIQGLEVKVLSYVKTDWKGEENCHWEWMNKNCPWEIIAWMPLPEPYLEK